MYKKGRYGFWRQVDEGRKEYNMDYKMQQSTNEAMANLRLGWIAAYIPADELRDGKVVDVGAGNYAMETYLTGKVGLMCSYDVAGPSISLEALHGNLWDVAIFADVIEHMEELEDALKIPWRYAYISTPETPAVDSLEDLEDWRHFKPGEHLWLLNKEGMVQYFHEKGVQVLGTSHVEDLIRRGEHPDKPNITSIMLKRGC